MTRVRAIAAGLLLAAYAAFGEPANVTLTVAAAANLSSVGDGLKAAFVAAHPGIDPEFVYASSGALTTQIENGAPFHIFMAADTAFPARVVRGGRAEGESKIYARGKLALFSVKARDFSRGMAVLADGRIRRIAIANPETAPYGKASLQALRSAGLWDRVRTKIVTAQNIGQAVQYATTAADIGFINKSALYAKDLAAFADKEGSNWIDVDPSTYEPIDQAFVVLKGAAGNPAAAAFASFLSSDAARRVFEASGYAVP